MKRFGKINRIWTIVNIVLIIILIILFNSCNSDSKKQVQDPVSKDSVTTWEWDGDTISGPQANMTISGSPITSTGTLTLPDTIKPKHHWYDTKEDFVPVWTNAHSGTAGTIKFPHYPHHWYDTDEEEKTGTSGQVMTSKNPGEDATFPEQTNWTITLPKKGGKKGQVLQWVYPKGAIVHTGKVSIDTTIITNRIIQVCKDDNCIYMKEDSTIEIIGDTMTAIKGALLSLSDYFDRNKKMLGYLLFLRKYLNDKTVDSLTEAYFRKQ